MDIKPKKKDPECKNAEPCENPDCVKSGELRCSRCKCSYYCSKECQQFCWKTHKKTCKKETDFLDRDDWLPDNSYNMDDKSYRMSSMLDLSGIGHSILPQYHLEYSKKYPSDRYGFGLLRDNYTSNQLQAFTKATGNYDILFANYGRWKQVLLKRWCFFSEELLDYIMSDPAPGSIYEDHHFLKHGQPYGYLKSDLASSKKTYQSLRNTAVHAHSFERGKCYVSVGFVDLHHILMANITGEEGLVEWHGYDSSKICVARAKLVLELISSELCSTKQVLQVWFSSFISSEAQRAVEKACH